LRDAIAGPPQAEAFDALGDGALYLVSVLVCLSKSWRRRFAKAGLPFAVAKSRTEGILRIHVVDHLIGRRRNDHDRHPPVGVTGVDPLHLREPVLADDTPVGQRSPGQARR
jgi:hypothetical protein